MKELFLFVRPPRPLWPFNGVSTAFWPPLAFASLAAALRERLLDVRVAILDAPALQMGWRSMAAEMRRLRPDYVGMGEEAVSCVEGLRLAVLAKNLGAKVIAGGCFFSHVAPQILASGLVDVVAHGEGEVTLGELVEALRSRDPAAMRQVADISFADAGEVVRTGPRPLLGDLDRLPFPAYDLLPVERYGQQSRNHPNLAAIESSRGCVGSCDYCVLWRQMGEERHQRLVPRLRLKSAERLLEEIRRLTRIHNRRYLGWVDPCFNADPHLPAAVAEGLLREGISVGQSAWIRADAVVRDESSGALATCVRAGLNEVFLGIERADPASLRGLHRSLALDQVRSALGIFARSYPEVFTVGSFIYGLPGDTATDILAIHGLSLDLALDKVFYIPLTPLPGTPYWDPALWDPTGQSFRQFNFLPGSAGKGRKAALDWVLLAAFLFQWNGSRVRALAQGLFHSNARRRRVNWSLFTRSLSYVADRLFQAVRWGKGRDPLIYPAWYEN